GAVPVRPAPRRGPGPRLAHAGGGARAAGHHRRRRREAGHVTNRGRRGDDQHEDPRRARTPAEWATLAASLLVLVAVGVLIVYRQAADPPAEAAFEVRLRREDVREFEGVYYLPLEVINRGDRTAEDVKVRVAMRPAGAAGASDEEAADLVIRFLAG